MALAEFQHRGLVLVVGAWLLFLHALWQPPAQSRSRIDSCSADIFLRIACRNFAGVRG